jgi:hypothetical protein
LRICSPQFLNEEINNIKKTFHDLGYPNKFVTNTLKTSTSIYYKPRTERQPTNKNRLVLPYAPNKDLMQILPKQISYTTKHHTTINGHALTPRLPNTNKPLVYRINCPSCNIPYIGETIDINRRMYQHDYDLRMDNTNSALVIHRANTGHHFHPLEHEKIINANGTELRKIAEAYYISSMNNINIKRGETENDALLTNVIRKFQIFPN